MHRMLIPCIKIQQMYENTENSLFYVYGANSLHQRSTHHMEMLRIFCYARMCEAYSLHQRSTHHMGMLRIFCYVRMCEAYSLHQRSTNQMRTLRILCSV